MDCPRMELAVGGATTGLKGKLARESQAA